MHTAARARTHTHTHTPPYYRQPLPLIATLEPDGVKICLIYIHVTWLKSTVGVRRVSPSQPLACAERYPGILTLKCWIMTGGISNLSASTTLRSSHRISRLSFISPCIMRRNGMTSHSNFSLITYYFIILPSSWTNQLGRGWTKDSEPLLHLTSRIAMNVLPTPFTDGANSGWARLPYLQQRSHRVHITLGSSVINE